MYKTLRTLCALPLFMVLTDCTSSQAIDTATALISGEIAGASAAGWAPGVAYGDLALTSISCVGTEAASADSAATKTLKITACVATAYSNAPVSSSPANQAFVAGIDAALAGLAAAFGAPLPSMPSNAAVSAHAAFAVPAAKSKLQDGKPEIFERYALKNAAARALKARK